ncbi:MAG: aldo/keto reductase [Candidatus Nanopelagicales bacterium]
MPSDLPLAPSRTLGSTGLAVSPLCLGGNVFGWTADIDESFAVLDAYVQAGGNFIDTADAYSAWVPGNTGGDSERILGEWMRLRENRAGLIVTTKVGKLPQARGLSAANINTALDASLERLQTDYIDVYYAHEDDPAVPLDETLAAFDEVVRSGKARHLGASNFTAPRLVESIELARSEGWAGYVAIQDQYNLMEREAFETVLQPVAQEYGLAVLPYYGLARGFLTGKYRAGVDIDSPRSGKARAYAGPRSDRLLAELQSVAEAHDVTMAAVALAWLLERPGVPSALASARNVAQLADLLPLGNVHLGADEVRALDQASGPD